MHILARMTEKEGRGKFLLWILIVIFTVGLTGCENIFGPKVEEESDNQDQEARIVVYNNYGEALDIYMDGKLQFTLDTDKDKKVRNVSLDEHTMQAKLPGTGTVVDEEAVDVTSYTDYTYTIDDPPDISISNRYGKTLRIYVDNAYSFNLLDEENRWIMNVTFGEHTLKAYLDDNGKNGKEIASTTIDVDKNQDYSWIIQ